MTRRTQLVQKVTKMTQKIQIQLLWSQITTLVSTQCWTEIFCRAGMDDILRLIVKCDVPYWSKRGANPVKFTNGRNGTEMLWSFEGDEGSASSSCDKVWEMAEMQKLHDLEKGSVGNCESLDVHYDTSTDKSCRLRWYYGDDDLDLVVGEPVNYAGCFLNDNGKEPCQRLLKWLPQQHDDNKTSDSEQCQEGEWFESLHFSYFDGQSFLWQFVTK